MMGMKRFFNMPVVLAAEFTLLFGGVPLAIAALKDRGLMITILWSAGVLTGLYLYRRRAEAGKGPDWAALRAGMRPVLLRFTVLAPAIALGAWLFMPVEFLSFPRAAPDRWLMVMVLYPLLSVWPQEVIYRAFLHRRYAPLWGAGTGYVVASAAAFGYMHIIFLNAPAVIMTAALGAILARDFARHRSLMLVCAEHALYGCLIFTVGLGSFFYSGAAWR